MSSLRYLLLSCLLFFIQTHSVAQNQIPSDQILLMQNHADQWVNTFVRSMTPTQMNITANVVFLLYANGLLDHLTRTYLTPLSQLSRSINYHLLSYEFPQGQLITIGALIEKLNYLTFTRTLYNTSLAQCEKYVNQQEGSQEFKLILEALDTLQLFGQNSLSNWIKQQDEEITNCYASTSEILAQEAAVIRYSGQFYEQLTQKTLSPDVQEDLKELATLETAKNVSSQLLEHIGRITDTLNITNDHVNNFISFGTEIYKYHYQAIHQFIMSSPSLDNKHKLIIFGPNGILPGEHQAFELPRCEDVLDQATKIASFYTAKPVSNQKQ